MTTLVIVDPIFRGSRLYYSWIISSLAQKTGYTVVIVTRTNALTEHAVEYFSGELPELLEVVELPDEFWYGKINYGGADNIVKALDMLLESREIVDIFFSGINELYPSIYIALIRRRLGSRISECRLTFIDYEPTWLRPYNFLQFIKLKKSNYRSKLKTLYNRIIRKLVYSSLKMTGYRIRLGLLDEYIFDSINEVLWKKVYGISFVYLPDPPPPIKISASENKRLPFEESKVCILLVGLQSSRKGLDDLLNLIDGFRESLVPFQFILSGRLANDMESQRDRINNCGADILWYDDYVSDQEIQKRYLRSDYVLLPYMKNFTSSSGVLATASSLGVPVIGTDHGLVGRRIVDHKLGFVYRSGNIPQLHNILLSIPGRSSSEYHSLSESCIEYSSSRSISDFASIILKK